MPELFRPKAARAAAGPTLFQPSDQEEVGAASCWPRAEAQLLSETGSQLDFPFVSPWFMCSVVICEYRDDYDISMPQVAVPQNFHI